MSRRALFGAALTVAMVLAGLVGAAGPAQAVAPPNDSIDAAVAFSDVPFTTTADTREATVDGTDADCGSATLWYAFTPSASARIAVDTFGSSYDTMLGLYSGSQSAPDLQDCNDDAQDGVQSQLLFDAVAGETVFISAGSFPSTDDPGQVGPGGDLVLTVDLAPDPIQVTVTAASRGRSTVWVA